MSEATNNQTPWSCDVCGKPGFKSLGPEGYCDEHRTAELATVKARAEKAEAEVARLAGAVNNAIVSMRICLLPPGFGTASNETIINTTINGLLAALAPAKPEAK